MTMLGAATTLMLTQWAEFFAGGPPPRPLGARGRHSAPDGLFSAADGQLALVVETDAEFKALCGVLGLPELAVNPRFAVACARLDHAGELYEELE